MKATYSLDEIKKMIIEGNCTLTNSALISSKEDFNLTESEVFAIIGKLTSLNFFKTMPSEKKPGQFQDVYHLEIEKIQAYIKVQIVKKAIIISFKKK